MMRMSEWKEAVERLRMSGVILTMLAAMISLIGCAAETVSGDAGCRSYAEARAAMPGDDALLETPIEVLRWVNETDARMTGTCR